MRFAPLTLASMLFGPALYAQAVPFQRVDARHELNIALRGVAVVRDSASWATLWHRFGPGHYADTGRARRPVPRVDFGRYMIAVIAGGSQSGCGNATSYVERIMERPDSIVVDMLPRPAESLGFPTTCTMLVNPIDVVRLPRNGKPVAFLAHPRQPFQPAGWLAPPNLAWLDRASEDERLFFLRAWARDPRTPPGVVAVMTYLPAEQIWKVAGDLLQRSDVRRDPRAVTALALLPSGHGAAARALLFDQHAAALTRDPHTSLPALGALVDELATRAPRPEPLAFALARHPGVQGDRALLLRLIRSTGTLGSVRAYACGVYVRKFPSWSRWSDTSRRGPDRWSHVIGCEKLPGAER